MRRTTETFAEYFTRMSPEHQAIAQQYQAVAGASDELWKAIYERTEHKEWVEDGIGSCDISQDLSEVGIAENDILRLREKRNAETPGYMVRSGCPNHRPGVGCVLGDLKSRKCLDYVPFELEREIQERFGIRIKPIRPVLDDIQVAGRDFLSRDWTPKPEVNEELVQATVMRLHATTDYVRTFPIFPPQTTGAPTG